MLDVFNLILDSLSKVWSAIYNFKIIDTISIFDVLLISAIVGLLVKLIYNKK